MYYRLIIELLKVHENKTLYGRYNESSNTTSYVGARHCFDKTEDYINGKSQGLSFSISRESQMDKVKGIKIFNTHYHDGVPYQPIKDSEIFVPIEQFKCFLEKHKEVVDLNKLSELFKSFIFSNNIRLIKTGQTSLFDFL